MQICAPDFNRPANGQGWVQVQITSSVENCNSFSRVVLARNLLLVITSSLIVFAAFWLFLISRNGLPHPSVPSNRGKVPNGISKNCSPSSRGRGYPGNCLGGNFCLLGYFCLFLELSGRNFFFKLLWNCEKKNLGGNLNLGRLGENWGVLGKLKSPGEKSEKLRIRLCSSKTVQSKPWN